MRMNKYGIDNNYRSSNHYPLTNNNMCVPLSFAWFLALLLTLLSLFL